MPRRKRRAYPSDLTNGQWAVIEPMIPDAAPRAQARDR
jgi:transposase